MRLFVGFVLAILVNYGLFSLMQKMISTEGMQRGEYEDIVLLDFVRAPQQENQPEQPRRQRPEPPPPPDEPPPEPPEPTVTKTPQPNMPQQQLAAPQIDVPLNITGGPHLGEFMSEPAPAPAVAGPAGGPVMDDEVVPLVRVPPTYPRIAQRRGVEGVVTVSFIITADGSVRNPQVIKATPPNVFEEAALAAIMKWKFKPRRVGGEAVERSATQEIEFKMSR